MPETHDETLGPEELDRERFELLQRLEDKLELPMVVLGLLWLVLLVVELVHGPSELQPGERQFVPRERVFALGRAGVGGRDVGHRHRWQCRPLERHDVG